MSMSTPTTSHHEIRAWAERNNIVPVEVLPEVLDSEPSLLRLVPRPVAANERQMLMLTWDEFFARFDLLGLACVYDDQSTGYNELLQIESKSPYRNPRYRAETITN